jgi:hypothetical protein
VNRLENAAFRFYSPTAGKTSSTRFAPCDIKIFVDRVSLTIEIEPRPVKPREIAPKGTVEQDGPTQADILLQAITLIARKPQTPATKGALRNLIAKFSCECGLDF